MAMTMTGETTRRTSRKIRTRQDRIEYRLVYAAGFLVFLAAAILSRLRPQWWLAHLPAGQSRPSILAEARAATATTIPFAFMG